MRTCISYALAFVVLVFLIAVPLALRSEDYKNTLLNHAEWRVIKTLVEMELMGVPSYLEGTQALAGNQLRLDAWHGYHEMINRHAVQPKTVSFRFFLGENAWLSFIFNRERIFEREEGLYQALRFSTMNNKPNALFEVDALGGFTQRTAVDMADALNPDGWNECRLTWDNGTLSLLLNNQSVALPEIPLRDRQYLGFRAGAYPARIDAFEVVQVDGQVYKTNFGQYQGRNRVLLQAAIARLAVFTGLAASFLVVVLGLITRKPRLGAAITLSLGFTAALTLWPWMLIERHMLAQAYPVVDAELMAVEEEHIEKWLEGIRRWLTNEYPPDEARPENTIMIVGSSQTWGSGANNREESWAAQLELLLNRDREEAEQVCVINGAVPGSDSAKLLELYRTFLTRYEHTQLLIVLGCNDNDPEPFRNNLAELIALGKQHNARPIVVVEALSTEEAPLGTEMGSLMADVAREHGVPFFDLHEAIRHRQDDGFFWWDVVHPTSFGHACIAEAVTAMLDTLPEEDTVRYTPPER